MQRGSSYGIPLLLLHVTIEGRPHSFARELRGDGLKITPKDGMKEIVEQQRRTRFFSKLLFFLPQKITLSLFSCRSSRIYGIIFSAHDKYYVPNNFYHEWGFPLNFFEPRVARKFTLIPLHLLIFTTRVITPSEKKS